MRILLVAAVLVGCNNGKVDAIEKRVANLEARTGIGGSADDAPVTKGFFFETIQSLNRDFAALRDRVGTGNWWCTTGCSRTEADCQLADAKTVASSQYSKVKVRPMPCDRQRVAFCGSGRCFRTHDLCVVMGDGSDCLGVE